MAQLRTCLLLLDGDVVLVACRSAMAQPFALEPLGPYSLFAGCRSCEHSYCRIVCILGKSFVPELRCGTLGRLIAAYRSDGGGRHYVGAGIHFLSGTRDGNRNEVDEWFADGLAVSYSYSISQRANARTSSPFLAVAIRASRDAVGVFYCCRRGSDRRIVRTTHVPNESRRRIAMDSLAGTGCACVAVRRKPVLHGLSLYAPANRRA